MERSLRSVVNQFVAVAFVLLSLFIVSATAQVSKGSISGTVIDPSGAVVSGAEVRATDLATNQVLSTNSDNSGLFKLPLLAVGTYKVEVSKSGFRKAEVNGVDVTPTTTRPPSNRASTSRSPNAPARV